MNWAVTLSALTCMVAAVVAGPQSEMQSTAEEVEQRLKNELKTERADNVELSSEEAAPYAKSVRYLTVEGDEVECSHAAQKLQRQREKDQHIIGHLVNTIDKQRKESVHRIDNLVNTIVKQRKESEQRIANLVNTIDKQRKESEQRIANLMDTVAKLQEEQKKQKQSTPCSRQNADGWTVILSRVSASLSFDKLWDDYVNGFFDDEGNCWIGLQNLHKLTCCNKQTVLRVEVSDWENDNAFAEYNHFKVENGSTNYRATFAGHSGTAGDSLSYHNGMAFSTIDRDNDQSPKSCSQIHGKGGWWYNQCYHTNPTGIYYHPPRAHAGDTRGIVWHFWRTGYNSLRKMIMKVRVVN